MRRAAVLSGLDDDRVDVRSDFREGAGRQLGKESVKLSGPFAASAAIQQQNADADPVNSLETQRLFALTVRRLTANNSGHNNERTAAYQRVTVAKTATSKRLSAIFPQQAVARIWIPET
jgi:hypothetical protein